MKVLILLYSQLLNSNREEFHKKLGDNVELLKRLIGVDSLYASVSSSFKDVFDRFPDLCLINSIRDSSVFAAYRGLRKLRGDDVLLVDGGLALKKDHIVQFLNRLNVTVGVLKDSWAGIAFIKMRDIDYVIKSLEKNFEKSVLDAFHTLRDSYSVITEFVPVKSGFTFHPIDVK